MCLHVAQFDLDITHLRLDLGNTGRHLLAKPVQVRTERNTYRQEAAIDTVLQQAESVSAEWAAGA